MAYFITPYERELPGFAGFSSIFRDMERLLRDADANVEQAGSWPRIQARNEASGYELNVDLPGLTEKDVQLDVHRGVLTLSGERKLVVPEGYRAVRRERGTARFSRSVQLPEDVNSEAVAAEMRDGVLKIRLPKRPDVQPKKIQIATH
jgi:HSP20 family protein